MQRGFSLRLILAISFVFATHGSTCPTFVAWLHVDNEVIRPQCGYGPCSNLDGFATIEVSPDATNILFTVQISNSRDFVTVSATPKPFSTAIPGSLTAYVYGPAVPGRDVGPGITPLLQMDLNPPTASMGTSLTQALLTTSNLGVILGHMRTGMAYVNIQTDRVPAGELRGQLGVPICYEAAVRDAGTGGYAFVNVLASASRDSMAALVRTPSDTARAFKVASSPSPIIFAAITSDPTAMLLGGTAPCSRAVAPSAWNPMVNTTFCLQGGNFARGESASDLARGYLGEVNVEGAGGSNVYYVRHKMPASALSDLALRSLQVGVYYCQSAQDGGTATAAQCVAAASAPATAAMAEAVPCRRLASLHDSLFSLARQFRSDWITVWSMNEGSPDVRRTVEPRYYAHPYKVNKGETSYAIQRRFGMSATELLLVNPGLAGLDALPVGSAVCVVPNWSRTMSGAGLPICAAGSVA